MLNELWFAKPESFNDPYDSHVHIYYHGNEADWITFLTTVEPWSINPTPYCLLVKKNLKLFEDNFNINNTPVNSLMRVACFSQTATNFLMWSHYSDFHRGICIGYNTIQEVDPNILYIETNDSKIDFPIINNLKYIPIAKVVYNKKIRYEFNQLKQPTEDLVKLLLQKSNVWKYEKEWRSFHRFVEYERVKLSERSIDSVCIGSKMGRNEELLIREIIHSLNLKRTKKIKLYKTYLSERTNRLARKRCKL